MDSYSFFVSVCGGMPLFEATDENKHLMFRNCSNVRHLFVVHVPIKFLLLAFVYVLVLISQERKLLFFAAA